MEWLYATRSRFVATMLLIACALVAIGVGAVDATWPWRACWIVVALALTAISRELAYARAEIEHWDAIDAVDAAARARQAAWYAALSPEAKAVHDQEQTKLARLMLDGLWKRDVQ